MQKAPMPAPVAEDAGTLVVEVPSVAIGPGDQLINIRGAALNYVAWESISDGAFCADKNSPGDS